MTEANGRRRLPPEIPPEIVEEILSYLPVKSLSRFRCVSTTWQNLISEHRFVRKHLSRAAQRLSQKTLIMRNPAGKSDDENLCCFPLSSLQSSNMPIKEVPRGFHLRGGPLTMGDGGCWKLVASCDGLLCISVDRSVYIWNPSTRLYWKIPTPTGAETFDDLHISLFGLGYDPTRDDYKLLKLTRNWRECITETRVYSLRGGSWRKFDNLLPIGHVPFRNAAFVNGSIHWLAFRDFSSPSPPFSLLSFDLSSDDIKCREMPLIPDIRCWPIPPDYIVNSDLCVLEGLLCVLNESSSRFVLWAMKDYSDQKSWTKLIDIEFGDEIFKPLHLYENGEVLMVVVTLGRTELMICKGNAVLFRETIIQNRYRIRYGFLHVDSLISPL